VYYLRILVGIPAVAVDVHVMRFLRFAGIKAVSYQEACRLVSAAADRMGIDRAVLDDSIWKFMNERRGANNRVGVTGK
jgi:hypothetical protein